MAEAVSLEDWKARYRELLTELEQKEGNWHVLESTLRSVASRLAITAMGRDSLIDKHLSNILNALKKQRSEDQLNGDLEDLAAAVLRHENVLEAGDSLDFSGFVTNLQLPSATQKRFIDELNSDTTALRMKALNELAIELNALLQQTVGEAQQDPSEATQQVLSIMAQHMTGVPELESAVSELKERMSDGSSQETLTTMLENLAVAVSRIIKSIGEDKHELKTFIEQVTQQLSQFEIWAKGNEGETQARQQDTDSLERNVEQQVGGLQSDIESSSEMSELKNRVQNRLDSIAGQLQDFRKAEARRTSEASKRNTLLLDEINRLKIRTTELSVRCDDQQERLMHDALTGAHTRYAYDQKLQEEFNRWQRHGQPLSYSIWDLDKFKDVNDTFGHQTGDRLLVVVASMLTDSTRVEDFVARIGGEEFVMLFPNTDVTTALALSERLRAKIADVSFHFKGQPIPVTVSCGITEFRDGDSTQSVYERADKALYCAKNNGRNRCETN